MHIKPLSQFDRSPETKFSRVKEIPLLRFSAFKVVIVGVEYDLGMGGV